MCDKDDKCDLSKLTEYDKKINILKYNDMYYGTIFVCIVYGIFAIAILLGSFINSTVRDIFFNQFIIFTVIFIIGSIIIIAILFYYIINYKSKKVIRSNYYDTYSCPDYWNMVMLDDNNVYKNYDSNISPNYFKYKCVLNTNIFDKKDNYMNLNSNLKQINYNLTNNLNNTTDFDGNNGDYYNPTNDIKINSNIINNNIGHLYKNINDNSIFPLSNTSNYFAYNRPGYNMTNEKLKNIKDAIIDSSLKINNYYYDNDTKNYSNITYNSYNDNNDPYIMWNYNKNTSPATGYSGNGSIENYYVYKWNYGDINYDTYKNLFKSSTTDNIQTLNVYTSNITNPNGATDALKIGELIMENNNIYFKGQQNTTSANFIFSSIPIDANNNRIVDSYIQKVSDSSTRNSDLRTDSLFTRGPKILVDNGNGRPDAILKNDINPLDVRNNKNIPVVCDTVYPAYLASIEDQEAYGADNTIRCSYAKLCGYSWSDMGCN